MELCPKCGKMTAETNHNTKKLICYNKFCGYDQKGIFKRCKKCKGYGYIILYEKAYWQNYPDYEEEQARMITECEECNSTGKVTWVDNILGK